jgi:hypothetical protein
VLLYYFYVKIYFFEKVLAFKFNLLNVDIVDFIMNRNVYLLGMLGFGFPCFGSVAETGTVAAKRSQVYEGEDCKEEMSR